MIDNRFPLALLFGQEFKTIRERLRGKPYSLITDEPIYHRRGQESQSTCKCNTRHMPDFEIVFKIMHLKSSITLHIAQTQNLILSRFQYFTLPHPTHLLCVFVDL